MKICCISDTHGFHRSLRIEESEILCIAGDISPLEIQRSSSNILEWLSTDFIPWCESLPVKKVVLVAGNHDLVFSKREKDVQKLFKKTKIVYLKDELFEYPFEDKVYKFWGSPWCTEFGSWAFMKPLDFELERFMEMPEDIDVLITHSPPYGACDICLEHPKGNYDRLGNTALSAAISVKQPKLCICGHLHSATKFEERLYSTRVFNVSSVNEQYFVVYNPLYLNI